MSNGETDGRTDAERSEDASSAIRREHGSDDPSGVDAAPADPTQDEDVPAEPPSAAR